MTNAAIASVPAALATAVPTTRAEPTTRDSSNNSPTPTAGQAAATIPTTTVPTIRIDQPTPATAAGPHLLAPTFADRLARPLRVLFVIDRLSRAGTESQLLALIRHLDRRRVAPLLCLVNGDDELSRALEPDDVPVLRLNMHSFHKPCVISEARRFVQFLRRERVDIVQTYFQDSTYFAVPLARLAGVRRIVRVRNNAGYWLTPTHCWLGRLMGRLVDVTLTNCRNARAELLRAEGVLPEKVVVLENGVDLERFWASPATDLHGRVGTINVGAVANLRPVKALDLLIEAAAGLCTRYPQLMFQVAGEGEDRSRLERLIAEHGLERRFQLLGSVGDVPAFLARQDIAVLCSHSEGMSNALLEYMAAGRAIVATAVGACERLIVPGVHGLVVPPCDVTALAAAMEQLVCEPDLAKRLATAARERVHREYSRQAMVRRFEEFYRRLYCGRLHLRPLLRQLHTLNC